MDKYLNKGFENYLRPGLESLLNQVASPQSNYFSILYQRAEQESNSTYSIPVLSYSVQGWKPAEGKVVRFEDYTMPLKKFLRGLLNYGRDEGIHEVSINVSQRAEEIAETVRHETGPRGHGHNLGDSEEQVTNANYKLTYDI